MAIIINTARELSSTSGTGDFILLGSRPGFSTLFSEMGIQNPFRYRIEFGNTWEVGRGHLSDTTTLVRDTVEDSSDDGNKVSFGTGSKFVSIDFATKTIDANASAARVYAAQNFR